MVFDTGEAAELGPRSGCNAQGAEACSCVVSGAAFESGSMIGYVYIATDVTDFGAPTGLRWIRAPSLDWAPRRNLAVSVSPRLAVPAGAFRVGWRPSEAVLIGGTQFAVIASASRD